MRLDPTFTPDAGDRGMMHSLLPGHLPTAPMSLAFGLRRQSRLNDFRGKSRLRLAPATCGDLPKTGGAIGEHALPPEPASVTVDAQLHGNPQVAPTVGFVQNNATAQRDLLGSAVRTNPLFKQFPVFVR